MEALSVIIESVDYEGKGIARVDGKIVFVDGAIAGEKILIEVKKRRSKFDTASIVEIIEASPYRVTPQCPNYEMCGGCSLQHIDFDEQIRIKQKVLVDNLKHIGNVAAVNILPPVVGTPWNYRHRARLSVRYVAKKGGSLVGFREKNAPYVVDMTSCEILPADISSLITPLRDLVSSLSIKDRLPQIEIAVGDLINVLVLRNMDGLTLEDEQLVKSFVDEYSGKLLLPLQIWLQPKGPDSCYKFYPLDVAELSYTINKYNITMPYYPSEFTQVNPLINNRMIELAIKLLDPQENDVIADFFCGIGNFTLPIANLAKAVVGIEGAEQLVLRAKQNAEYNALGHKTSYQVCNLFTVNDKWLQELGRFDKWLIDPPRTGAIELLESITPKIAPKRIVYVSCNPATLARDANILVDKHGYTLVDAGIMNMFPHTSHVESIAVFELTNTIN